MRNFLFIISFLLINCKSDSSAWITLFDGKTLDGWEMKISGYEFNNNYLSLFEKGGMSIIGKSENNSVISELFFR